MADLVIRGMKMPKNGYECPMNSFGICHVTTDDENCECYDVRPEWCPLLPLPAGHGRLIDADEARNRWLNGEDYVLLNAPTIVPAEGGKDDGSKTD